MQAIIIFQIIIFGIYVKFWGCNRKDSFGVTDSERNVRTFDGDSERFSDASDLKIGRCIIGFLLSTRGWWYIFQGCRDWC